MEHEFKPGDFVIYERPTDGLKSLAKVLKRDTSFYFYKIKIMEREFGGGWYYVSPGTLHPLEEKENDLSKALDSVGLL